MTQTRGNGPWKHYGNMSAQCNERLRKKVLVLKKRAYKPEIGNKIVEINYCINVGCR
jgi:hypothetical protein